MPYKKSTGKVSPYKAKNANKKRANLARIKKKK